LIVSCPISFRLRNTACRTTRRWRTVRYGVLLCLLGAAPTSAFAQSISTGAYATLTSDYVFRGISLTSEKPAVQGGLDLGWKDLSVSLWASNVDFGALSPADVETDIGAVWSRQVTDRVGLSLQAFRFIYIGDGSLNYSEYSAIVDVANATIGFYVAPGYGGTDGDGLYLDLGYAIALPKDVSLGLHAGRNEFEEAVGIQDYWDYAVSLSRSFGRMDLDVSFLTTDLPKADESDARVVGSVTVNF
jgi:uncharacterized protein (TIGR02001 family)